MSNLPIAIIGAGPAGLTAAYQIAKRTAQVELFEASPGVGGLARSIPLWGQTVDIGPHRFFSSDTRVNSLWLEVVGQDYEMVDRLTRIYYKKRFFHYPLKPFDALFNLGIVEAAHCVLSFLGEKIRPTPQDGSFESWVCGRFGRRLFEIFFKTYSEKLWGISCRDLDADFAAQRIKKLSLWEAIKNGLLSGRGNQHKTLVDQFAYPRDGSGMVYDRMADFVRAQGGQIHLRTPIEKVLVEDGRACGLQLRDGSERRFSHIISSMPLTQMVARLPDLPAPIAEANSKLTFRNTIIVYLRVEHPNLFPDNWLYVHSNDLQMGRITNFRNWVPSLYGDSQDSILAIEYWCYGQDEFWNRDDEDLIELARRETIATGLTRGAAIPEGKVHRIPRCYPVYGRGYKQHLLPIQEYLSGIRDLHVIGRYGAFKYNNQDHSILMGMLAAENVLDQTRHDLWGINTDYENYQESSIITRSGLVKQGNGPSHMVD